MPKLKKIITIDNDIVLSRKKTFFHDAEYTKKRKYRKVSIYRPDGTLLKSEEIGKKEHWICNYRIIKEYDENENLVKKVEYNDENVNLANSTELNKYNSDGHLVEQTLIYERWKSVRHYQIRKWEEDGWRNTESIVSRDVYDRKHYYDSDWKLSESGISYKVINVKNPEGTYGRHEEYDYKDGSWILEKSYSYSFYYDIEGHLSKREYMDGDICYYEDYNLHGDYETYRIRRTDGTQTIYSYRYKYDSYGRMISKESFKDGIKQWEILRQIEYCY